jgi:outer membrane protein assembly factor BamB
MNAVRRTSMQVLGRTLVAISATVIVGGASVATALPAAASPIVAKAPTYTWPKYGHDGANTGLSADPAISTANAAQLGVKWMVPDQTQSESSPVVEYDAVLNKTVVYLGNEDGSFTAFDASTGAILWSENLGSAITSTPLVANGAVWVARSFSPVLFKLDAATGAVDCQSAPLQSIDYATPTIGTPPGGQPTVFIGDNGITPDGPTYAIAAADCSTEWKFVNFNTSAGTWDPYSFAVDAHGVGLLLVGTDNPDATVYAINAITGKLQWSYLTQNVTEGDVGTGASVTAPGVNGFADGAVYISNNGGYTYALDLTTGALYWRFDYATFLGSKPGRGTAAVVGNHVIVPGPTGAVCLNAVTGSVIWNWVNATPSDSAAAVVGPPGKRVVAVTDLGGNLDVLNAATGALLYQHQTGGFAVTSVAESNGNFYVSSGAGFLYDFAPGGANSGAPSTAVTSLHGGSVLANPPTGNLTLSGTATGTPIASVDVAVQSGGSNGPWWDATTGLWSTGFVDNETTLTSPGSSTTNWSLHFPVPPAGGVYSVQASATGVNGQADLSAYSSAPSSARISFSVNYLTTAPHLTVIGDTWVAPAASVSIQGSGFTPGEQVDVALAGAGLLVATADPTGTFSGTVTIPATAAFGKDSLVATGVSSHRSSTAAINVSNQWKSSGEGSLHQGFEPNDLTWDQHIVGNHASFITQAWSYPSGAAIRTSPTVVDDVAYFGNDAGTMTALGVRNSQPNWTYSAGSAVDSSVAVISGLVIFGTIGGSVVALSSRTGQLVWQTSTSSAVESSPSTANGDVFVGSDDGTVYALNQTTGAIAWQTKLAGAVKGSPSVDPVTGEVAVGDSSGAITALSATTGATLWSVPTGGPVTATPTIDNGDVFVGSQSGTVLALNETTGASVWTFNAAGSVATSGAFWTDGFHPDYVVGDSHGDVYFLTLTTGAVQRLLTQETSAVTGVTAAEDWAVVTFADGEIYGDKFGGELTWVYQGSLASSPVTLQNGVSYVAGQDGAVRAFTVPGTQIP